jgi:alcohol dehydrogenase (cytochrome c)/quinohemoprotein ethanol dehydrogenase
MDRLPSFFLAALFAFCAGAASAAESPQRIVNADSEPGNWLSYGRTYSEQHFSPLKQIDTRNISKLGLAWSYDIEEPRPVEAMPLVVDGVMYVTMAWSKVAALDAATGRQLWLYDPEVPKSFEPNDCCRSVNRGAAYWNGKVYVGALDGRLIAIDAKSGKMVWQKETVDHASPYASTGAPRVVKGKVIIGNSGADLGVRGYVSAYDAETGDLVWRFYTVPGDPSKGFENDAMKMAAKTWKGEWWKFGGGGTVWESIVYDPDLDLLYVGTGNGSPWNQRIRSPGGGDNLFLASILALRPDTGDYVWHYQVNPGETWDYTATQPMILADLKIGGEVRKVLMQAPKNGFFYVLDRTNGKLISAQNHVPTNWASRIDVKTGRPVENPAARYPDGQKVLVQPGGAGGHNWPSMAFSPTTVLVYLNSTINAQSYGDEPAGIPPFVHGAYLNTAACRACPPARPSAALPVVEGETTLVGWDPVNQKAVWRAPRAGMSGAGVLATAGDLVVQGGGDGNITAYDARDGKKLWFSPIQNAAMSAPIAYRVGDDEYIAIAVGEGYSDFAKGDVPNIAALPNTNRVLAFKLNATLTLPPVSYQAPPPPKPPVQTADAQTVAKGREFFNRFCFGCHGIDAGSDHIHPDLRYSDALESKEAWANIVIGGARKDLGMRSFSEVVSTELAEAMRQYVIGQSLADAADTARHHAIGPLQ